MNTRYKDCPEIISTLREINSEGDDLGVGDRVMGVQVRIEGKEKPAIVQLDVRNFKKQNNLILEVELSELVAAISVATLNADKNP